jgi:hypothetical protein
MDKPAWTKRDKTPGEFMGVKKSAKPAAIAEQIKPLR